MNALLRYVKNITDMQHNCVQIIT